MRLQEQGQQILHPFLVINKQNGFQKASPL
jgi:hypothetical protein